MVEPSKGETGGGLPAPYESPWRQLARDLRAVAADLLLRLRALIRRNREGSLLFQDRVPGPLKPWLWPLLLALPLLALLLGLVVGRPAPTPSQQHAEFGPEEMATSEQEPLEPQLEPSPQQQPQSSPEMAAQPTAPALEANAPTLGEQLLAALTTPDDGPWLRQVEPEADGAGLVLRTATAFQNLDGAARRRQANLWLERSQELGYGQLVLVDAEGRELGRSALVGSGMILAPAPADG